MIGWCLAKLGRQDVPSLVTITPLWQAQPWFPRLFQLAIARPRLLPTSPSLLLGRDQEPHPLVMTVRLPLLAWLLSAIPSQARDVQRKWSSCIWPHGGRNTERAYASAFNVWASWGASLSPTIAEVLQFLSDHYGQGRQYWTVAGYRSALSQTLPSVEGLLVGQHPLVCRLLRGDIQPATPLPHYQATRDVRKVLDLLCECGPSPQFALPQLTRKTAMLLALTGANRCSEVHPLDVSS